MKLSNLFEAYRLYHNSYSDAIQHAVKETQDQGYQIDEDDFHNKVTTGPRKPDPGEYNRFTIDLLKDNKPINKKLHMQIYHKNDSGKYELNMYIN
jgi:hypothetical protein